MPVLPVRVGRRAVDTSVLNGFPDSQHPPFWESQLGAWSAASCVAREAGFGVEVCAWLKSSAPSAYYCQVLGGTGLALGEPVVPRRIRIPSIKLLECLQTAYQKVVVWFFHPVFAFRIVVPFDEIENSLVISPAVLDRGHNFFQVVFLPLFDVVRFPQHLRGVRRCPVFASSLWFE